MKRLTMSIPESVYVLGQQLDPLRRKTPYSFLRDLLTKAVYEERSAVRQQPVAVIESREDVEAEPVKVVPIRKGRLVVTITKRTSRCPDEWFISEKAFQIYEQQDKTTVVIARFMNGNTIYGEMRWDVVRENVYDSDKLDPDTGNPFMVIHLDTIKEYDIR